MYREYDQDQGNGFGRLVVFLGAVFLVALAVVVGTRLSQDAIGVLVGVIAGVAASIPTAARSYRSRARSITRSPGPTGRR